MPSASFWGKQILAGGTEIMFEAFVKSLPLRAGPRASRGCAPGPAKSERFFYWAIHLDDFLRDHHV